MTLPKQKYEDIKLDSLIESKLMAQEFDTYIKGYIECVVVFGP